MIIERIDRLPNGNRIVDGSTGQDIYYLNKCPYCEKGHLYWESQGLRYTGLWAIACDTCEASTDFYPSKFDALEGKLHEDPYD